jgi:hypothetical protein
MIKPSQGSNPYLHALSRSAFAVHREAYGALPVIVRREAALTEEIQRLNQAARHEAAFKQIARRFGQLGIPENHITKSVVDPLAAVIAQTEHYRWLRVHVDACALTSHPSEIVMQKIAAMTDGGSKSIMRTASFIDSAGYAFGVEIGLWEFKKSLEGEPTADTLARMHEIAAKCEHGLIRWQ